MKAKIPQQRIKQTVASSLIIWLSGIVFLLCCEMPTAQASNVESCPLAKIEHCSKQSSVEINSDFALLQANEHVIDCCNFLSQVFDKARKIEKAQKIVAIQTSINVFSPSFSVIKRYFPADQNFNSVLINRENTYLKNCVFRI